VQKLGSPFSNTCDVCFTTIKSERKTRHELWSWVKWDSAIGAPTIAWYDGGKHCNTNTAYGI
jgi:hypothetical protein